MSSPLLCTQCIGPNPYIRMILDSKGKECSVCQDPFPVYSWRPEVAGATLKTTVICVSCAKAKNLCQSCLLDLKHHLPAQVRDSLYQAQNVKNKNSNRPQMTPTIDKTIKQVAAQINGAQKVCYYFQQGKCNRGKYCPFAHVQGQVDTKETERSIQNRYYGVYDENAQKYLKALGLNSTNSQKASPQLKQGKQFKATKKTPYASMDSSQLGSSKDSDI